VTATVTFFALDAALLATNASLAAEFSRRFVAAVAAASFSRLTEVSQLRESPGARLPP
jgi:hypothetical protein